MGQGRLSTKMPTRENMGGLPEINQVSNSSMTFTMMNNNNNGGQQ